MTAATIQSNNFVSSEVKDNQAPLEPSDGKNVTDVLNDPADELGVARAWKG